MSELAIVTTATGSRQQVLAFPNQGFDPSLFKAFLEWVKLRKRSDATLKSYESFLNHFYDFMKVNSIVNPSEADILAYSEHLEKKGFEPTTQAHYMRAIKQFFAWTESKGRYCNIAADALPVKIARNHTKNALPREAVASVAESIDRTTEHGKRLYAMYMLMITAGLRDVQVARACLEDIETVNGRTWLYIQGKGHTSKDDKVQLIPEVRKAIDEYRAIRTGNTGNKQPLFTSTSNRSKGKALTPASISADIKKLLVNAGQDSKRITAHSLRHTSATGVYKATGNLFLTQQHQRHADPKTTEIYIHAEEREERTTEQQVFNYYFSQDKPQTQDERIAALLQALPAEKKEQAIRMLEAIVKG